jgi:hypothetical protein
MSDFGVNRLAAVHQFREARRKAVLVSLLSRFTGKSDELLPWEEVSKELDLMHPNKRYLENVPLDKIVGSVNRYHDFNRQFYPLSDDDQDRWAKVQSLVEVRGLEPVEMYKVGDAYFVFDGNHRVSVARQNEATHIEAYVNEFRSKVEIHPEDSLEDVILRVEYEELLEDTQLEKISVDLDFRVTVPGRYREVYEHISVHCYYLGLEKDEEIPILEATKSWVKNVYLPVIKVIRDLDILKAFPGRTETDLYLWLKRHEWELEQSCGVDIPTEAAAYDLTLHFSKRLWIRFLRWWKHLGKPKEPGTHLH